MENLTVEKAWDILLEMGISEETLNIVTDINGYNMQSMIDILRAKFGYNSFDQLDN